MHVQKIILKLLRFGIFLVVLLFIIFLYQLTKFLFFSAFANHQPIDYVFPAGFSTRALAEDLAQKGIIQQPNFFIFMAKLENKASYLKAGGYAFEPGVSGQYILTQLYEGRFAIRKITFIEGWNLAEIRAALLADNYLQHASNYPSLDELAKQLGIPDKNPEGWFFPDTYQFIWGISDQELLLSSYQKMQIILALEWQNRAPNLPYETPYQALIVASLVEKEAKLASERPLVAEVILNRLKKRMRLQIDPTIIYAMGENYHGKITKADLKIKSPYNTYLHYGLPPTPISSPGLASIRAALHPEVSKALYFVARGDGSHEFSNTLREQNAAVKKYLLTKSKEITP